MVPMGTYFAWILIVTGDDVLIVVSGKTNGFALMGVPLIAVTMIVGGGVAGRTTVVGVARYGVGLMANSGPMSDVDSIRMNPLPSE